MIKAISSIALSVALITLAALPASARYDHLRPQVDQRLTQLGIKDANIKKVSILPRRRAGQADNVPVGYEATVSFHDCRGHLALVMNRGGDIKEVYNRSACSFPGIPNY